MYRLRKSTLGGVSTSEVLKNADDSQSGKDNGISRIMAKAMPQNSSSNRPPF
jgi:hypothetical protein